MACLFSRIYAKSAPHKAARPQKLYVLMAHKLKTEAAAGSRLLKTAQQFLVHAYILNLFKRNVKNFKRKIKRSQELLLNLKEFKRILKEFKRILKEFKRI